MSIDVSRSMIPSVGSLPSRFFVGLPGSGEDWLRARYHSRKDIWVPRTPLVLALWPDALTTTPRRAIPTRSTSNPPVRPSGGSSQARASRPIGTLTERLLDFPRLDVPGVEISPEYHALSEEKMLGLKAVVPQARFIAIIRDPVDQALSLIARHLGRRIQLGQFWGNWSQIEQHPDILPACDQESFLQRWARTFPPNELQILGYGALVDNPKVVGDFLDEFLELPSPRRSPAAAPLGQDSEAVLLLRDRFEARLRHRLARHSATSSETSSCKVSE